MSKPNKCFSCIHGCVIRHKYQQMLMYGTTLIINPPIDHYNSSHDSLIKFVDIASF